VDLTVSDTLPSSLTHKRGHLFKSNHTAVFTDVCVDRTCRCLRALFQTCFPGLTYRSQTTVSSSTLSRPALQSVVYRPCLGSLRRSFRSQLHLPHLRLFFYLCIPLSHSSDNRITKSISPCNVYRVYKWIYAECHNVIAVLSVCLSVTLRYCVKTAKYVVEILLYRWYRICFFSEVGLNTVTKFRQCHPMGALNNKYKWREYRKLAN